ncbi:hypothetical protein [Acetobacterium tundrae]|nr:hypothetical protein [Acetobacterium tundrae]
MARIKGKKVAVSLLFAIIMVLILFSTGVFAANVEVSGEAAVGNIIVSDATPSTAEIGVEYRGHVQDYGDYPTDGTWIQGDNILGTTGESKRIEGVNIKLTAGSAIPAGASIRYNVHIENVGWQNDPTNLTDTSNWKANGDFAGSRGKCQRIEAIQIVLVGADGQILPGYSVQYLVHGENYGWTQGWKADGAIAGTTGQSLRLEVIQIKVVKNAVTAYDNAGTYGSEATTTVVNNDVIVNVNDVVLQNLHIKGDLIVNNEAVTGTAASTENQITAETSAGGISLNNVIVDGTTYVRSGGENSTQIIGGNYNDVLVREIDSSGLVFDLSGQRTLTPLTFISGGAVVNGGYVNVEVRAPGLSITMTGRTVIDNFQIAAAATGSSINLGAETTVGNMLISGDNTNISGQGTINHAAADANNIVYQRAPINQTVAPNVIVPPVVKPPEPPSGGGGSTLSSDADLTAVLGQAITSTGIGISASPKTSSISVDNAVGTFSLSQIVTAPNATKMLYTNSNFIDGAITGTATTPLMVGDNTLFIKVTAQNSTSVLYYEVTITRASKIAFTNTDDTITLAAGNQEVLVNDNTYVLLLTTGTPKTGDVTAAVAVIGLPEGLTYTATGNAGVKTITITVGGTASAAVVSDVTNVSMTIMAAAVSEPSGVEAADAVSTFCVRTDKTPPAFESGYPQVASVYANGSRTVEILANTNRTALFYYIAVEDGAMPTPTPDQVINANFSGIVSSGNGGTLVGSKTKDFLLTLPEDGKNYEVYLALVDMSGNKSEIKKVDVITPPAVTASPVLSNVTTGLINIGDTIEATSDVNGNLYLVQSTTAPNKNAIENAAIAGKTIAATANTPADLDTSGLAGGTYYVYAIGAAGNVSAPSAAIIIIIPEPTTVVIAGDDSIAVSSYGDITSPFSATVYDQNNTIMPAEAVSWALKAPVEGVTVDASSGDVTIATATAAEGFTIVATSTSDSTKSAEKDVVITVPTTLGISFTEVVTTQGVGPNAVKATGSISLKAPTADIAEKKASATITYGTPEINDTVTVAGIVFTFGTVVAQNTFTTQNELVAEINAALGTEVLATSASDTIEIQAVTAGTAGNTIALNTSNGNLVLSSYWLTGGIDGADVTTVTVDGTTFTYGTDFNNLLDLLGKINTLTNVNAGYNNGEIMVRAKNPGEAGNTIALSKAGGGTTAVSGATLTGGLDTATEVADLTILTGATAAGNIIVEVNSVSYTVAVADGDTKTAVAVKIAATLTNAGVTGYAISNTTDAKVTFTSTSTLQPITDIQVAIHS